MFELVGLADPKHREHWKHLLELKGALQDNLGLSESTKADQCYPLTVFLGVFSMENLDQLI